jgi:hypothetical protein
MFGTHAQTVNAGQTFCATVDSVNNVQTCLTSGFAADNQTRVFGPAPTGGVAIAHLAVAASATVGGAGTVVTVLDNGVATALTCTVTTTTCANDTATVSIPAGDFLQVQIAGGTGVANAAFQVTFAY